MSTFVICPSCNEENAGSAVLCRTCRSSLAGVLRQERQSTQMQIASDKKEPILEAAPVVMIEPIVSMDVTYAAMFEKIRSWGIWSLILGALHIFTNGFLSAPWGVLLILVGLASFYFRSASMFVIYAVTLSWAAISNMTSFEGGWIGFALYQFYLAFRVFQDYRSFRDLDVNSVDQHELATNRAVRFFPWLGFLLGLSSFIGFILLVVVVVVLSVNNETIPDSFGFLEGLTVNFAILGIALGAASLLSGYRLKALAIFGIATGALTVLVEMAFIYLL